MMPGPHMPPAIRRQGDYYHLPPQAHSPVPMNVYANYHHPAQYHGAHPYYPQQYYPPQYHHPQYQHPLPPPCAVNALGSLTAIGITFDTDNRAEHGDPASSLHFVSAVILVTTCATISRIEDAVLSHQRTATAASPPPKTAPKSWADLVRTKNAAAAAAAAATATPAASSQSVSAVNGFAAAKSDSMVDVLRTYDANAANKVAFLEPRGLVNTGNMCYMNSILQTLVFCIPFFDFLDQVGKRAAYSFKSETPLLDAMIMFMREFPVIDSAVSQEQLRLRLKDTELEQYGDAFTPEFVYDVIKRLPRFSHMRRFQYDNTGGTQKIWKKVGYPLDLEIPKEVFPQHMRPGLAVKGGQPKYRLTGVVYHHGKTASGGHYTVDVRRQDGREWIRMDDTILRRIRSEDVAEGGSEEDPRVLAKALEQHKKDSGSASKNIFEQAGFDEDDEAQAEGGWSQVNGSGSGATKKWSGVVNGTATPASSTGKRTPMPDKGAKDNKVAYILFYERVRS
ncbi:Peptidase C19 ubiquitin carboxyl-terminal hydrolase 2 [Neofusicoccum parvum]|nr:Peptidase C19 ubiquitin carboxyl-terminal hydrolase 2 [Neofusicoccum parvum]